MAGLVDNLLEYSKATSESQNFEPIDLNEILDEIKIFQNHYGARKAMGKVKEGASFEIYFPA